LPIENVKERFYRGFCKSPELTQYIRKEFLEKKEKLLSIPDLLKGELNDKEITAIKKYLEEFFDILNYDGSFKKNILDNCRTTN
jgi:hypothetical protein